MYKTVQNKKNAVSVEFVDGHVQSLALCRSMSMSVFSYVYQTVYCILNCHISMKINGFRIFTLLHFVKRRGGGEDSCVHTLVGHSLRVFDDISTFDVAINI